MKDGKSGVAIKEFFGLKSKMYSFLVDDSSKYKKVKGANKTLLQQEALVNTKIFCGIRKI